LSNISRRVTKFAGPEISFFIELFSSGRNIVKQVVKSLLSLRIVVCLSGSGGYRNVEIITSCLFPDIFPRKKLKNYEKAEK
jgi:hypothetical protein